MKRDLKWLGSKKGSIKAESKLGINEVHADESGPYSSDTKQTVKLEGVFKSSLLKLPSADAKISTSLNESLGSQEVREKQDGAKLILGAEITVKW